MNVYVARHGESTWNREGRYQGQRDAPLSETGRAQARALSEALAVASIDCIVASPLTRCVESARPLAERLDLDIRTDALLMEISHGTWEGRLRTEIERDDPETMRRWRETPERVRFEGGESLSDVLERWRAFVASLSGKNNVVVVTHDVLVRLAILDVTRRPLSEFWKPRVVNGSYTRFLLDEGRWSVLEEYRDEHLTGMIVDTNRQAL